MLLTERKDKVRKEKNNFFHIREREREIYKAQDLKLDNT